MFFSEGHLTFGVGVAGSVVKKLQPFVVAWEWRGAVWSGIRSFHPRGDVFLEDFINEGFDVNLDVMTDLVDINTVIHIQVALAFDGYT